jgi:hypothetical protein
MKTRTPFETESADLQDGLQNKSAEVGLEVKSLDTDDEEDADTAPAATASSEKTIEVEFIHHFEAYGPGDTEHLPARQADTLCGSHVAKRVEKA